MTIIAEQITIKDVAKALGLGEPNEILSSQNELRYGNHGSFVVDLNKNVWHDHEGKAGGGVLDLVGRYTGLITRVEQMQWLQKHDLAAPDANQSIVAAYDYVNEAGTLLFQVVRREPKKFSQRRPDGSGGWEWKVRGTRQVPYRLLELLAAPPEAIVYIAEGEKDCDRLASLGLVATCNAGGARKWRKTHAEPLRGRRVVVLPDNDEAGRDHARQVLASLRGVAADARIIELPGLPEKGDISDWLDAGGTVEVLRRLGTEATAAVSASPVAALGPQPLDDIEDFYIRFVAYPSDHACVAHVLWTAHAHLMEAWESTPRIAFLSPEAGSGKSRALEVTELLVPRPVQSVNVSSAYLFRKVGAEDGRPTILYDEIDTVFGPRVRDANEEIRGLLNAGHRRHSTAGRCVVVGKTVKTEELPAYCAVALAGLGDLPDTILSRCVIVRMRRRAPGEEIEPFRHREHREQAAPLRERIEAWAAGVAAEVEAARPAMPDGVCDRDADVWEALLAVADAAGGDWPKRARVAAVALVAQSKQTTPSLGVRLLADLRQIFGNRDTMSTNSIIDALCALDEAPWGDLRGKAIDARGLARRLKPYDIAPKNLRDGSDVLKGYARGDMLDAWMRYLGTLPTDTATRATGATTAPAPSEPTGNGVAPVAHVAVPVSRAHAAQGNVRAF